MESRVNVDEWKVEWMQMDAKQSGCGWMGSRVDVDEWEVEWMWMNVKQSGCGWMESRLDVDEWEVEQMWMNGKVEDRSMDVQIYSWINSKMKSIFQHILYSILFYYTLTTVSSQQGLFSWGEV